MSDLPNGNQIPSLMRTTLTWVLLGLFLVSSVWFAILYARGVSANSLDMEFAKALLQVGVVSVAAAILSLLISDHQRHAETQRSATEKANSQLQFRDEVLKNTLTRITASYNATKRARRKIRALGQRHVDVGTMIYVDSYDECMADVNDAQLDLEVIKSDVKTSGPAYPSVKKLTASLRRMEKYLGALFQEYENVRTLAKRGDKEIRLTEVPRLADFIGPADGSIFATEFSATHTSARDAIRSDLLHLSFAPGPLASPTLASPKK